VQPSAKVPFRIQQVDEDARDGDGEDVKAKEQE
jgi:hypothetical protein